MDPTNRQTVRKLAKRFGVIPKRHLGQNFLVSGGVLQKILRAANVQPNETILEIGGGLGAFTVELAKRARRVVVVERDPKLCAALTDILAPFPNIHLICADARSLDTSSLFPQPYTLVSNLPYGVATVILRNLLEGPRPPKECFVMIQRDVAQRIVAQPPHAHLMSVAMQYLAEPKILFRIPKTATWPVPDVESVLLHLKPRKLPPRTQRQRFMETIRLGFSHPRKYALNNLTPDAALRARLREQCSVGERSRPQELTLKQWQCVASSFSPR